MSVLTRFPCGWVAPAAGLMAVVLSLPSFTSYAADTPLRLSIKLAPQLVFQWPSRADSTYRLESSVSLSPANWQTVADKLPGSGGTLSVTNGSPSGATRFYRLFQYAPASIAADVTVPAPDVLYPGNTLLGVAPLGFQFRIPAAWKGGIPSGSSTSVFVSDTEPGAVLGVLTLSGDANFILRVLPAQFPTSPLGGFSVSEAFAATGNQIAGEWSGYGDQDGKLMRLEAVVHPSGGIIGFIGLFTAPNRAVMRQTLGSFVGSTLTVPRLTDSQWTDALKRRAFKWTSYKSSGNGGNNGSLASWSDNNAFFCDGTYDITRHSESTYSGNLSGGGFYTGGGSSDSTESGDWTVLQTPSGPVLVLLSGQGIRAEVISLGPSGNSFYFGDQEFSFTGPHACALP